MIVRRSTGLVLATSAFLAAAAKAELDSRRRHLPAMVKAGTMERGDALADLAAWRAIAALFGGGELDDPARWAQLELATSRALIHQSAKAEAAPADRLARDRLEAVQALHERIAWHRWHWTDPHSAPPAFPIAPLETLRAESAASA